MLAAAAPSVQTETASDVPRLAGPKEQERHDVQADVPAQTLQPSPTSAEVAQADAFLDTLAEHAATDDMAADNVLYELYASMTGKAIKPKEAVVDALVGIRRRRQKVVLRIAREQGVAQPAQGRWTVQELSLIHI